MSFVLTILGCNSAIPTASRYPSAQLLNIQEQYFLIDCGEGTQIQLRRNKLKFQRIGSVFISHMHGDHFFGLVGLITTMQLLGREKELKIFGPQQLETIIKTQINIKSELSFPLKFTAVGAQQSQLIYETSKVEVHTIVLNHKIPCTGFLFKEKLAEKTLLKAALAKYKVPIAKMQWLKQGNDLVLDDGTTIPNSELTLPPPPPRTYAYCSDTAYSESIIPVINGADLLYHEATFMQELEQRAKERYHSTTIQAATIAKKANVKKLIIGHYSARYSDLQPLLDEACSVFPNTVLGVEGERYEVE